MKFLRFLRAFSWWIALVVICAYSLVFALPSFFPCSKEDEGQIVLSLWHVDSFEGGRGSRASFLKAAAKRFGGRENVMMLVSTKSVEGVRDAWAKGERPDLLSFGAYAPVDCAFEKVDCWCYGKYALYSRGEGGEISPSNTILSLGGKHLPQVAAAMHGLKGEYRVVASEAAYVPFLNGEYQYLFGTQRDACRFQSRGVQVIAEPIDGFSDLMQYIAVVKEEYRAKSDAFIEYLLSQECQELLTELGLFSRAYSIYSADVGLQHSLETGRVRFTLSPFTTEAVRGEIVSAARQVMLGADIGVVKSFLKGV